MGALRRVAQEFMNAVDAVELAAIAIKNGKILRRGRCWACAVNAVKITAIDIWDLIVANNT